MRSIAILLFLAIAAPASAGNVKYKSQTRVFKDGRKVTVYRAGPRRLARMLSLLNTRHAGDPNVTISTRSSSDKLRSVKVRTVGRAPAQRNVRPLPFAAEQLPKVSASIMSALKDFATAELEPQPSPDGIDSLRIAPPPPPMSDLVILEATPAGGNNFQVKFTVRSGNGTFAGDVMVYANADQTVFQAGEPAIDGGNPWAVRNFVHGFDQNAESLNHGGHETLE